MTFAHGGREPFPASHPENKDGAGGSELPRRPESAGGNPVDPRNNISTEELVEARERTDAGLRLAFPSLFDQTTSAETPRPLDPAIAALLAKDIGPMREQTLQNMVMLDANLDQAGVVELHMLAATVCATLDEMAAVLRREIAE